MRAVLPWSADAPRRQGLARILPQTGTAQQWYIVLERDAGAPDWEEYKRLCHQRFGSPISTNHLADLARLPFTSSVESYLDTF